MLESGRHVVGTLRYFSPLVSTPSQTISDWSIEGVAAKVPRDFSRGVFSSSQISGLEKLYCCLHSVSSESITMTASFRKYKEITLYGRQLGSYRSRSSSSSTVMASWNIGNEETIRPARMNYFAEHSVCINSKWVTPLLGVMVQDTSQTAGIWKTNFSVGM